jgi:hypothetical protein
MLLSSELSQPREAILNVSSQVRDGQLTVRPARKGVVSLFVPRAGVRKYHDPRYKETLGPDQEQVARRDRES